MNKPNAMIIVIDDDTAFRESLAQLLGLSGYGVVQFDNADKALKSGQLERASCFLLDVSLPGMSGLQLLEKLVQLNLNAPVVIMTGHGDISTAVDAMKKGAYDFIEKPFSKDVARASVARAVEKAELAREKQTLKAELELARHGVAPGCGMVGGSPAMARVRDEIKAYAGSGMSVLISGETGTGKELVARALHDLAGGKERPFVAVNLAALPETLAMGELFGYEKGAFTGAAGSREGKFEYADGGTLLLDEVNSASQSIQAGILRAVEEKTITRLGGNKSIPVDTRIIATTNEDLHRLADEGKFRLDLLHRLGAVTISVPPLRERLEDIAELAVSFIRESCRFYGADEPTLAPEVIMELKSYQWPGNIRELKNVIGSLVLQCHGNEITSWGRPDDGDTKRGAGSLKESMDRFEKEFIVAGLRKADGNVKATAKMMGIPRRSLYDKMAKHGLNKQNYK